MVKRLADSNFFKPYVARIGMSDSVWHQIANRMSESHRHYHTLYHLAMMLSWHNREFDIFNPSSSRMQLRHIRDVLNDVIYAVMMHDFIYDPTRSDNEERSANFARLFAPSHINIEPVVAAILNTKNHSKIVSDDLQTRQVSFWLNDLDLLIFQQKRHIYAWYARGIRKEYAHVPDAEYQEGRARVLTNILESFDSNARSFDKRLGNIKWELRMLKETANF